MYSGQSTGTTFDVYGGVKEVLKHDCLVGCQPNGTSPQCIKEPGCVNKAGLSVCKTSFIRGTCSSTEEKYFAAEDCTKTFVGGVCEVQNGAGICTRPSGQLTGQPNSYLCVGSNKLYSTDAQGFLSTLIDTCGVSAPTYCSDGTGYCKYCELNLYNCDAKTQYQCADPKTGSRKNEQNCEVGCLYLGSGNTLCDQLSASVSQQQFFFPTEQVAIKGSLKGSESRNAVITDYEATITNPPETVKGSTNNLGELSASFGIRPLGTYDVVVTFPSYGKTYSIKAEVTNNFVISLFGEQVVLSGNAVPLQAKDSTGAVPDDLVTSKTPEGVQVTLSKTAVLGRWEMRLTGTVGIYQIGLKPIKNGILLNEQFVTVEVRQPQLEITSNIPSALVKGSQQYEVTILSNAVPTEPDLVKATVSYGTNSDTVSLSKLGGGRYLFLYNFVQDTTYTVNIEATKIGHNNAQLSKVLQASSTGTTAPPTGSTPNITSTPTVTTPPIGGGGPPSNIAILAVAAVAIVFIIVRSKKR